MASPKFALWLDLETAGTDPHNDPILEIGAIVTRIDAPFAELATFSCVTRRPSDEGQDVSPYWGPADLDPVVRKMHTTNGLLAEIEAGGGVDLGEAETALIGVLRQIGHRHDFVLAGSGVGHFDRRFLDVQTPQLASWLRYYCLDVGVVRRFLVASGATGALTGLPGQDTKPHRAAADIALHLAEARHYAHLLGCAGF